MITKMYLLNVPLDKDYKHTLYFDSSSSQKSYFDSKVKHSYTDFTYQRKDNTVRVPIVLDDALKCNYVMYQNTDYSNKWYYAFITDYVWNDEDTTTLTIETDVLQTYMFDYTLLTSFVEREHCADDTIGLNTFPENLEMGEYVCEYSETYTELQEYVYVVAVSDVEKDGKWETCEGYQYNGLFSGLYYYYYTMDKIEDLQNLIKHYSAEGKNESIKCLFTYPIQLLPEIPETWTPIVHPSTKPAEIKKWFYKKEYSHLNENGYRPKNNKLYVYPYQYLLVDNNNGGTAIYQFEHFIGNGGVVSFSVKGCLTPGGSIRMTPLNYKGINQNMENQQEGLNLGKLPICNWTSDEYTNWLTQNGVNIGLNMVSGVGQIVAGVATAVATGGAGIAVGGGMAVGGVSTIAGQLAQIHQMSFTSGQSRGNVNCGDVITANKSNTFTFYQMRIKEEYVKIIDEFFEMFGYKCNRVKVPEKAHRENWWFTKTIDVNISGDVPQVDMEKIKNCYNAGITFWRNDIKNYNRTNAIV